MATRLSIAMLLAAAVLASCSSTTPADLATRTLEGFGRSLCDGAGNCRNTCPDGSATTGPLYQCPTNLPVD